jgi:hypothetical protein
LAIKYLEALGRVANGQATKIFLPADFASGLSSLGAVAELFAGSDGGETERGRRAASSRAALDEQLGLSDQLREQQATGGIDQVPPPPVAIPTAPPPPPETSGLPPLPPPPA